MKKLLPLLMMILLSAAGAVAESPIPVTIGCATLRINLPVFVAQERGIFKKHGLEVSIERFDTAQPVVDALVANRLQVGGYAALPISYAAQARSGVSLVYTTLMLEDARHRFSYLIVPPSSPCKTLEDLRGKRVGVLPTIAYRVWLESILKAKGVADVTIQNVAPALQASALGSGAVDALWTNDPMATAILQSKGGRFLDPKPLCPMYIRDPFPVGAFTARLDWVKANPEAMRRLVAALDEAIGYLSAHQQEARACVAPYVAEAFKASVAAYPDSRYLPSGKASPAVFSEMMHLYRRTGILDQTFSLEGLVFQP